MGDGASEYRWLKQAGRAFGAPGMEPHWTSSSKDAVGMAYSAASRVWFTMSHGILNECYYPTIDRPQMRDMGLMFSDEGTFFHEEKRDLESRSEYIDPDALAIRTVGEHPGLRYKVTKEVIAEPHHSAILVRVTIEGPDELLNRMKAYVLLAPHLEVGGKANNGRTVDVAGQKALLCWRGQTALAMGVDCGFTRVSCGYSGRSDGWQDLDRHGKMTWEFDEALDGNIAVTGEVDLSKHRVFTIALGFGDGPHAAISGMMQALAGDFNWQLERVIAQWHRAHSPEELAPASTDGGRLMRISHNVLLTHEDKTYSGAFIASASIPWGQAKSDDDLGGYHLVWTRDMVQQATGLLACGRTETALRALVYLACTQRANGSFAQNFWIDGTPYWTGIQLDEVAFPIMLAWRLWKMDGLGNFDVYPFIMRAAAFLMCSGPVTQEERWEECAGYSPSTLAAVIAGIICAGEFSRAHGQDATADFLDTYADWLSLHLEEWTTTNDGVLHPDIKRHYIRINPPRPGDPYASDLPPGMIRIANRGPGEKSVFEAREIVDAGFLELVRYGVRRADDPLIADSLKVVDKVLKVDTQFGPCWRRYNHDGYGQGHDGSPFITYGQGHAWPLLSGERAHYELERGGDVKKLIFAMEQFTSEGGMICEQIWDEPDIPKESMFFGRPSGSAMPLAWAHAEYLKLLRSVTDGRIFDQIPAVVEHFSKPRENKYEFWQMSRPLDKLEAGKTLRIMAPGRFRVDWTLNGWADVKRTESTTVTRAGYQHADIPVPREQTSPVSFTLYWLDEERWEGRNYDVLVIKPNQHTGQPVESNAVAANLIASTKK